jgi:cAMP-dependent protein kinase regulator
MTLPKPFLEEIQTLSRLVIEDEPADWLQYCADYFHRKLSTERKSLLASSPSSPQKQQQQQQPQPSWAASVTGDPSAPLQPSSSSSSHQKPALSPSLSPSTHHHLQSPIPPSMASSFASPFGANSNPFGGGPSDATSNSGLGMHRVIEEEESDILTSPTTPRFGTMSGVGATLATTAASAALSSSTGSGAATGFRAPFGGDDAMSDSMPPSVRAPPNTESYPEKYNFGRRTSVSAESLKPSADTNDNWTPPYHEKTPEQLERLKRAIASNFLFSHLDDEQADQVLGALVEKPIPAKDIKVRADDDEEEEEEEEEHPRGPASV